MVKVCRRPASHKLLGKIIEVLPNFCLSPLEVRLLKISFCLAFFVALRVSELVSPSKNRIGGLAWDDVVMIQDVVRVHVRRSKKYVFGHSEWLVLPCVVGPLCPVVSVSEYMVLGSPSAAFLSHQEGTPLTRFQFSSVFKQCLKGAGLNAAEFGNSFVGYCRLARKGYSEDCQVALPATPVMSGQIC